MKILILLALAFPILALADILTGVAKNNKGEILYIERHDVTKDEAGLSKLIQVEYSRTDGSVFAKMTSDFTNSKTIPLTTFEDKRFNTKITLHILNSSVVIEDFKDDKKISKKVFPRTEAMVAGQGFDNFIRMNMEKLKSSPLEFKFAVLEKRDFFSLTGFKKPKQSDADLEYGIKASNWFLKLFAQELRVVYDAKTLRLKSFSGPSNLLDDSGNSQNVVINYTWDR